MQCVWVLLIFLRGALSQKFKVKGPGAPVVGVSSSDVVLPCSVRDESNKSMNAVDLDVTWSRLDLSNSQVHLYMNHEDLNTDQIPFYRRRTAVFKEELKNGNVSLKISNVQFTDQGLYRCRVDSSQWFDEYSVTLSVEVIGSKPVITVEKYESGKFSLLCESNGWNPKPDLQWRNSKGVNLTAETEAPEFCNLFTIKSRITVEKIDSFSCTVSQRHHVMKGEIDADTLNEYEPNHGRTAGITIGVMSLLVLVAGVIIYRRRRRLEIRKATSLLNSEGDRRLINHNLSDHQWDHVEKTLLYSEHLKEFDLGKFHPSDRGVQKLQKVIAESTKAKLEGCGLSEESCKVLASVLISKNSKLTELDLGLNNLKDSGVKELYWGLKSSHCKLHTLRLENCNLTEGACAVLASVLLQSDNFSLIELNLSQNYLQDSGVKKLYDGLKDEHCKLKILRLENCNLTEGSCGALASVLLQSENSLIELNLSKNHLRDKGVQKLYDGLKDEHCKLKILRLADCNITDIGCADLINALQQNPSSALPLEELDLSRNLITESGWKMFSELKAKFPDLKVKLV